MNATSVTVVKLFGFGTMSRYSRSRRGEFECVVQGLWVTFLIVFALPVLVTTFAFLAIAPNAGSRFDSRSLLSIAFSVSLIPGVVVLIYRALRNRRCRFWGRELALSLVSLALLAMGLFLPFQARPRAGITLTSLAHKPARSLSHRAADHRTDQAANGSFGNTRT
jgi:hypothetical protein